MATDITLPAQTGPALYYLDTARPDAEVTRIDMVAVEKPRERALCRGLLLHALALIDDDLDTVEIQVEGSAKPIATRARGVVPR